MRAIKPIARSVDLYDAPLVNARLTRSIAYALDRHDVKIAM